MVICVLETSCSSEYLSILEVFLTPYSFACDHVQPITLNPDCFRLAVQADYNPLTTSNIVALPCHAISLTLTVLLRSHLFEGIETKMHEDDDEEKKATIKEVDYHAHSKQTKKRLRHVQRQVILS